MRLQILSLTILLGIMTVLSVPGQAHEDGYGTHEDYILADNYLILLDPLFEDYEESIHNSKHWVEDIMVKAEALKDDPFLIDDEIFQDVRTYDFLLFTDNIDTVLEGLYQIMAEPDFPILPNHAKSALTEALRSTERLKEATDNISGFLSMAGFYETMPYYFINIDRLYDYSDQDSPQSSVTHSFKGN